MWERSEKKEWAKKGIRRSFFSTHKILLLINFWSLVLPFELWWFFFPLGFPSLHAKPAKFASDKGLLFPVLYRSFIWWLMISHFAPLRFLGYSIYFHLGFNRRTAKISTPPNAANDHPPSLSLIHSFSTPPASHQLPLLLSYFQLISASAGLHPSILLAFLFLWFGYGLLVRLVFFFIIIIIII